MENLIIHTSPETPYFPRVNFNYETGVCEIIGESFMEETYKFYAPLMAWLEQYIAENKKVVFNIKLTYFNTSSSRSILDILDLLREYSEKGGDVEVFWYYDPNDPDMEDEVEDFRIESGLDLKLKTFK
jgi:hypothetical protein